MSFGRPRDEMVRAQLHEQLCSDMGNFRELVVWKRAQDLALAVYRSTSSFPKEEPYGLTSQMRRAAVSVSSNIAEGCGRQGDRELARFLQIARGSVRELECQLILSRDLGYLQSAQYTKLDSIPRKSAGCLTV